MHDWYLHSLAVPIVHGDLKPANVMVEMRFDLNSRFEPLAKVIDFGLSRVPSRHAKPLGGTLHWTAPEVHRGSTLPSPSADIFAFGCIMFFMLCNRQLYTQLMALPSGLAEFEHLRLACSAMRVVVEWTKVCEKCLAFDPLVRWDSKDLHAGVLVLPKLPSGLAPMETLHERERAKL